MQIRKRLAAITMAVLSAATVATVAVTPVASADDTYGEFIVGGRIEEAYKATGGPDKWGNPLNAESPANQGGRFQRFEKTTSFYWKANVDNGRAHQIGGAIRAKWGALGFERGALKYPISDEQDASGKGRKQFMQGGNLYYSSSGGTHPVWGGILGKWAGLKGSGGFYGMPVSDEYRVGTKYAQDFQGGTIMWP